MTNDEIIDELFIMFDNLSFSGVMLDDEEERLNELFEEYVNIRRKEGTTNA